MPADLRPARGRFALDPAVVAAILVTLGAILLYARTAYRTTAFWDSGEFIATSWILGIPHQPSTPLYVLLGRLATLVPLFSIAIRVNWPSALPNALAAGFTVLATARLGGRAGLGPWARALSGALAGILVTSASSLWTSASEAEVYALSGLMVAIALWAVVRNAGNEVAAPDLRPLLAVLYLLSLSIGIHLGTLLVAPALFWFAWRTGELPSPRADLLVLLVGWPLLGFAFTLAARGLGLGPASPAVGFFTAYLACLPFLRARKVALTAFVLVLVGVSVHLYLPIRAALHPAINEGDPADWRRFFETLSRAQYPPSNPLLRRGSLAYQFGPMFLRYVVEQWPLFRGALGGVLVPLAAVAGAWLAARRDRLGGELALLLLLLTGPALVIYLNFTEHEVRERDYFFALCFQALAIWAGLAGGFLLQWLGSGPGRGRVVRVAIAGAILVLTALHPIRLGFRTHDKHANLIARDYAANLLLPLPRDAVLFTNGDNDTFPLWYLQEVEGVRKDVRVVNLSLLNTPWYIRQLRDQPPTVPITMSDAEIDALRPALDQSGSRVLLVKDFAVQHILAANRARRPLYLAVTVPDRMGLDKLLVMEGLAQRIHAEPQAQQVDLELAHHNLYEVFTPLHGILTPDGQPDTVSYRDRNESSLVQNYAAIHFYLGVGYDQQGDLPAAIREAERALAISPKFMGNRLFLGLLYEKAGDLAKAERHYQASLAANPGDPRLLHRLGRVIGEEGRSEAAVPILKEAIARGQRDYFDPWGSLFEVYWRAGKQDSAVQVLDQWLTRFPNDIQVREVRDRARAGGLVAPPAPGAPSPAGRRP